MTPRQQKPDANEAMKDLLAVRRLVRLLSARDKATISRYGGRRLAAQAILTDLLEAAFKVRWAIHGPGRHFGDDVEADNHIPAYVRPRCLANSRETTHDWGLVTCPDCWAQRTPDERRALHRLRPEEIRP